jgi:periplasmic protein TonB
MLHLKTNLNMESSTYYLNPSWNNLVFEKRNKEFGAFQLRKRYAKNVVFGLLICTSFTVFSFSVPMLLSLMGVKNDDEAKLPKELSGITLTAPPVLIPVPPAKPKEPIVQAKNTNLAPKVVTDLVPDEPLIAAIEPSHIDLPLEDGGTISDQTSMPIESTIIAEPKKIYSFAEKMPVYETGLDAMQKFLLKNVRYPAIDRRNGTEGTVYVQFIIDEIGTVSNVEVIKGISTTLDNEAMRVIASMKQWKPGSQNGQPVSIRMVIPIKFKLSA